MFDAWTTSANAGVLGIRVCYIDENFDFHIETISTERIIGSHDANLFEGKIKETLDKRGLYGKVWYIYIFFVFELFLYLCLMSIVMHSFKVVRNRISY